MEKEDEENGMEKENVPTSQRESSRFPVIDDKTVMSQEEYAQNLEYYYQDTVLTETELADVLPINLMAIKESIEAIKNSVEAHFAPKPSFSKLIITK